jgi:hypothetical protein
MGISISELGGAIDALYNLRETRLDLERKAKEYKQEEQDCRNAILECLSESGLEKASGMRATCGIKRSTIPLVTDWDRVFEYIVANDRFDLVQKRISVLAWRDLYNDDIDVPGTEAVEDIDISLTKSSRS